MAYVFAHLLYSWYSILCQKFRIEEMIYVICFYCIKN